MKSIYQNIVSIIAFIVLLPFFVVIGLTKVIAQLLFFSLIIPIENYDVKSEWKIVKKINAIMQYILNF